jgi:hypothetical protein
MKTGTIFATAAAFCLSTSAIAAEPAPAAKPVAAAPAAKPAAPAKQLPKRTVGDNSASKAPGGSGIKPRTAISIDCSKQADAKDLHGKAREKFRNDCKKGK